MIRIANARGAEGFVAVSADARKRFWQDRARTAAIARHTNAFKVNEDVVIPLPRLADYTDGIERINIEFSLANKLRLADELAAFLASPQVSAAWPPDSETRPPQEIVDAKVDEAREVVAAVRARCQDLAERLDATFPSLQDRSVVVSWKRELKAPLDEVFAGLAFAPVMKHANDIHARVLKGRRYRLSAVAVDAAGNRSTAAVRTLRGEADPVGPRPCGCAHACRGIRRALGRRHAQRLGHVPGSRRRLRIPRKPIRRNHHGNQTDRAR